jgi:hypothetical protein
LKIFKGETGEISKEPTLMLYIPASFILFSFSFSSVFINLSGIASIRLFFTQKSYRVQYSVSSKKQ